MKSLKLKNVLLWICVLPSSILAYLTSHALVKLGTIAVNAYSGESLIQTANIWSITNITGFIAANIIAGYLYILVGTSVAPTNKKIVATVLSAIAIIFTTVSITLYFVNNYDDIKIIASAILTTGTSIYATIKTTNDGLLKIN